MVNNSLDAIRSAELQPDQTRDGSFSRQLGVVYEGFAFVRSWREVPGGNIFEALNDCRLAAAILAKDEHQSHHFAILLDKIHHCLVFI